MDSFKDKNIVILGASSAIAQAVARRIALENANLFLLARNQEKLETIASDLKGRGAKEVNFEARDLAQSESHDQVIKSIYEKMTSVDVVFLAYGVLDDQLESQNNFDTFKTNFNINMLSAVSWLHRFAEKMIDNKSGTLAVITSVAGDRGRQSNYAYGCAKGALSIFLSGLRHRLKPKNVHVLDIRPGFVDTPMTADVEKGPLFASPDQVAAPIMKAIRKKSDVVYTPWFWYFIMLIVRNLPNAIFHKTKL